MNDVPAMASDVPVIEVVSVRGLALIQDLGRRGHMHEGVPPGGALVPEWLACANHLAGNAAGRAAIETFGELTLTARTPTVELAFGGRRHSLRAGERITVSGGAGVRVSYVALAGGIDVPEVLGGRGTLLIASLGGLDGRLLRTGDVLRALRPWRPELPRYSDRDLDLAAPVRVIAGPDQARFDSNAMATLVGSIFTISPTSDRVGSRLRGATLTRIDSDSAISTPMVRGAVQVPASGEPIVLGPDHPTTGGYPVLATVIRADLGALAARPIGAAVRFRAVSVDEARAALCDRRAAR